MCTGARHVIHHTVYPCSTPARERVVQTCGATGSAACEPYLFKLERPCIDAASVSHLGSLHGWDVTYLPVNSNGLINVEELKAAIRPDTAIVSVMVGRCRLNV
jgi:cysteine sulfinate desulfinase/cysteine desulfurase-like protein